jgi:putative transposase
MELEREEGRIFNLKKIVRIKKKLQLKTIIRKKNPYRASFKNGEEHKVAPNLLDRNFNAKDEETILSTDITELRIKNGQKAYLSATKNIRTKEIVNYNVSSRPTVGLVIESMDKYLKDLSSMERSKTMIHSDQGFQYTSYQYRYMLEKYGVTQSMSRKGSCLDNSPIESFFGHLKDEVDYKNCKNVMALRLKIKKYVYYYNNERPQWALKQKTPAEARVLNL